MNTYHIGALSSTMDRRNMKGHDKLEYRFINMNKVAKYQKPFHQTVVTFVCH